MANQIASRAPRNVAQALAEAPPDVKIAQVVAQVAASEPEPAPSVDDTPSEAAAPPPAEAPAPAAEAPPALVRVRNSHCASVYGVMPGQYANVPREIAQRYSWAWR